jgi:hypothetical protein
MNVVAHYQYETEFTNGVFAIGVVGDDFLVHLIAGDAIPFDPGFLAKFLQDAGFWEIGVGLNKRRLHRYGVEVLRDLHEDLCEINLVVEEHQRLLIYHTPASIELEEWRFTRVEMWLGDAVAILSHFALIEGGWEDCWAKYTKLPTPERYDELFWLGPPQPDGLLEWSCDVMKKEDR